ncbi:hypothetical protein AB1287_13615 [Enterobacter asburiae]|uniref:hypothetical protein n=1 Tax=Scandinavium sp. UTDF21-P1B TaxID=3446379 RepID=UPI00349A8560
MHQNSAIISYLQANNILSKKLDRAASAVRKEVMEQVKNAEQGATRALNYLSCFTDEYHDVCKKQGREDARFFNGVVRLLRREDIVGEMLRIYFDEVFRYRTTEQLEYIKQWLLAGSVHIASSSLTKEGFAFATAALVKGGLNLSMQISALASDSVRVAVLGASLYGVVQKAADSAYRLHIQFPAYYAALYTHELEMMYFLIEPVLQRAGALEGQFTSDSSLVDIIRRMIQ